MYCLGFGTLLGITRAPTFIETETRSTLELGRNYGNGENAGLVFNVPNYSSRNFAKFYKDDVANALFSVLRRASIAPEDLSSPASSNNINTSSSTAKP